jgi:hypothetical protein
MTLAPFYLITYGRFSFTEKNEFEEKRGTEQKKKEKTVSSNLTERKNTENRNLENDYAFKYTLIM